MQLKRYGMGTYTDAHEFGEKEGGDYVLAADYEALVEVVRELLEYTNESCRHCGNETCDSCLKWGNEVVNKALALVGEKGD